jgi:hypothetical protein
MAAPSLGHDASLSLGRGHRERQKTDNRRQRTEEMLSVVRGPLRERLDFARAGENLRFDRWSQFAATSAIFLSS